MFTRSTKPRIPSIAPTALNNHHKSPEIAIRNNSLSPPGVSLAASLGATSYKRKSKLKVNNVVIDQLTDNPLEKGYILINSVTYEATSLPKEMQLIGSFTADYESTKLQTEIENLKKMRLNYGTDWLLSTPKLQVNEQPVVAVGEKSSEDSVAGVEQEVGGESGSGRSSISNIVDSFVVYRSEIGKKSGDEGVKMCILSLSESSVIEKDELNAEVLSVTQLAEVCDIVIAGDGEAKTKLVVGFKDSTIGLVYQFENNEELRVTLFLFCLKIS